MQLKPINTYINEMPRSGIRRVMDSATEPDMLHLDVGQPNFSTPEPILRAACEAIRDPLGHYTRYTPNMGYTSLREKIAVKLEKENGIQTLPERILVTPGSNYGIMVALSVLLNPKDEVLVPDPGYVNYSSLPPQFGCTIKRYPLFEADGFKPRIESIAKCITQSTKVIVHNSPSNPTGAVCSESFIHELIALAQEKNLYILSDEAYEHIVFEGRHISPARFDANGNVVSIFSVSKSYSMTGWRIGYAVAGEQIAGALEKQQELCVSCAPSISQKAAEAALSLDHGYINKMVKQYRTRRDIALKILKQHGLYRYTPQGAFYLLLDISATRMDSNTFADRLLEEKRVAVAPGATFGPLAEKYIRISLATEEDVLVEGLEKTCNYINRITL